MIIAAETLGAGQCCLHRVRRFDERRRCDAHRQLAAPVERAIDAEMAVRYQCVQHTGEAVAVGVSLAPAHTFLEIGVCRFRHAVAGPFHRLLVQHAGRYPVGIAREISVVRVRHTGIEADQVAGLRVDDSAVVVGGEQNHRAVRHHGIERAARQVAVGENTGIPAVSLDPVAFGMDCGEAADGLAQFRHRVEPRQVDIESVAGAGVLQMDMRVLKARQHQPSTSIDDPGFAVAQRADVGIVADRKDACAADRHGAGARPQRIKRPYVPVENDDVGHAAPLSRGRTMAQSGLGPQEARHSR